MTVLRPVLGGAAAAGPGGLPGEHQLRELRAPHNARLSYARARPRRRADDARLGTTTPDDCRRRPTPPAFVRVIVVYVVIFISQILAFSGSTSIASRRRRRAEQSRPSPHCVLYLTNVLEIMIPFLFPLFYI